MGDRATAVVDANVLLNLATPVVDGRDRAPSGADPLRTVLSAYDVHAPATVMGEIADVATGSDLLGTAATLVLRAATHIETHDIAAQAADQPATGLDAGESRAVQLANDRGADLFVTDEFNSTNYLLVSLALDDRNTLFTTPHVLCRLATAGALDQAYVRACCAYYCDTKDWDRTYVDALVRTRLG